jgi:hypothetical protein
LLPKVATKIAATKISPGATWPGLDLSEVLYIKGGHPSSLTPGRIIDSGSSFQAVTLHLFRFAGDL